MRSLILSLLLVVLSVVSYGQTFETCADSQMPANVSMLTPAPSAATTLTIDPAWTTNAEGYTPSNQGVGFTTAYWTFSVNSSGFYSINIEGAAGSPAIGNAISVSLSETCAAIAAGPEIFAGNVPANLSPETATCTNFVMSTSYTIAMAIDPAFAGDIIVTVVNSAAGATNTTCGTASPMSGAATPGMDNTGDNSCSAGLVWYNYIVVEGGSVTLTASTAGAASDIPATDLILTQYSIDNCTSFTPIVGNTVTIPCLPVGTVVSFEAGDDTAPIEQGNFTINIVDDPTGVANETCDDVTATATIIPTCMTTTLTVAGTNDSTLGACPDDNTNCANLGTESTVWFAFITDATAQTVDIEITNGSISGTEFALIDGVAGCPATGAGIAIGGCQTGGSLLNQAVSMNNTYYIAVSTAALGVDGTFTLNVTPQNPPANDDCATGALDIALGSSNPANAGVSGTTSCATPDANDFCATATEDHVVYYEYTVDPAILTNRDVIINIQGDATNSNAATNLIFGLFEDCAGTAYMNPAFSGDACDAVLGAVTYKCVEPGTVLTIAVGSSDGNEGDFTITITEDATMLAVNDACADATGLSVGMACVPTLETVPNNGSCPEVNDLTTSCLFSSDKTVWHTITLPAGADEIEFTDLGTDVQLALFENMCAPLTLLGGDCFTTDMTFTGLTPGGTYLLAASLAGAIEGDMTFTWTPIIPIANDECDVLSNPVLTDNATLDGTTGCADSDLDFCTIGATGHDVFYTYTNMTGANTNITITINDNTATTGTATTDVSVGVYEDCLTTMFAPNECNTLGTAFTLDCIQPLQQLVFIVASPDGSEGDFDIMLNEDNTGIATNDLCSGAIALQVGTTCETTMESVTNMDACPEATDLGVAVCDLTEDAVAWYSLVMPAGATELDFSSLGANVQLSLFDNVCPNPTVITSVGGNTCITADDEFTGLTAGNTYLVAVSLAAQAEGTIAFSWTPGIVVANDDCDAVDNPALTNTTPVNGTTACADGEFDFCTLLGASSHGVFYTYTNGTGGNVDLDITVSGNTAITGVAMTGLEIAILLNCTGALYQPEDCSAALGAAYNVDCIAPDDQIIIYIASNDGEEGDFSISVVEDTTQPADDNDNCIDALVIDASILNTCEFFTISGSTADACPENFTVGGCTYTTDATVWYSFTTPTTTNPLTVDIQSIIGQSGAYTTIFTNDCAALVVVGGCDTGTGPFGPYTVMSNTTYLIAVGDGAEGDHSFEIQINELPVNDDPCMAEAVAGTAGDANVTVSGTTVCATQDYAEPSCGADNENTVWYEYTIPTDATGFEITIEGTGSNPASSIAVGAFETTACGGGTPTLLDTNVGVECATESNPISFQCLTPGTTVFIYVGTSDTNSGTFDITFDPLVPDPTCIDNDLCADADVAAFASLVTDGGQVCIDDCNAGACPESFMSGACDYSMWPTVFYSVTTDALAIDATMSVNLSGINGTIADPIFSIYTSCAAGAVDPASDCIQSGTLSGLDIMPSTTYIIAVALEDAAGGEFQLCVTVSTTCNDDPCTPFELTEGMVPTECTTTVGASDETFTYDDGGCADMTTSEATVYYTYIPSEGVSEATITFTNDPTIGITGDMIFTVVEFDPATCSMAQTTILGQECGPVGGIMPITVTCPTFNEPILIQIGSTTAGAGEFDIVVNETLTSVTNDICSMPETTSFAAGLECEWMDAVANTVGACPESFDYVSDCGFDDFPVVWFQATAPAGATGLDIRVIAAAAGVPFIGAFEGNPIDCDDVINGQIVDCQTNTFADLDENGLMLIDVMPGDVILIGIGTDDPAGSTTIDFSIKWNVPPMNDECDMAVTLMDEIATAGSTACATEEDPLFVSGACAVVNQENTVWYEVTVPAGSKGFTITATTTGGMDGFTDPMNIVVFETESTACDISANSLMDEVCVNSGDLEETFECVGPGTYIIRLATSGDNEGEFDVEVDILDAVDNDNCDDPNMDLEPALECVWMETTANSEGACPEDVFLDPTACGLSVGAVVWYEITAPLNATFLDIRLTSGNGANPIIAVFPGNPVDCDNQTFAPGSTCYDGTFTDLIASGNTLIPVTGGNTYLIAVGVTDPAGSMIDFGIKWITPPDNDECVDAVALDLATLSVDGTTACATQPLTGEYDSDQCSDADETNTVFYTYVVPDTDKGFNVSITATTMNGLSGDINLVVFEDDPVGACATGPGAVSIDDVCTTTATVNEEFECVGAGTYVIRVSTSSDNEGGFTIEITPLALEQPNDNCDMPDVDAFMADLECEWMVIDAETIGACPEDLALDPTGCGISDFPVTWYEATAPANAEFLDLQINFGGVNPFLAVYEVGPDCDALTFVAGSTCYAGTFDNLNDLTQPLIDVIPGTNYLIAVGTDALAGGTINFGIKWITPPDNDECVDAEDFDNLLPAANPGEFSQTLVMETTQCATGPITGTDCDDDNTNTVWYTYTVEPDVKEITIDITNWMNTVVPGGTPNFSISVLDGCIPGGSIIAQADGSTANYCGTEGTDLITLSCLDEGDIITILVSSSSENEGTFDITLNTAEPECVYTNDECPDAVDFGTVIMDDPIDCVFVPGCNDLACTEFDFSTVCPGIDVLNSVFFTFTTDDLLDAGGMPVDAAFVNLEIISGQDGELDNPGAILLSGDCTSLAVIGACAGTGGGGEFNSGPLGMPGQILPNTTYTVVVYNSNDMQNGGTFELCITVTSGCVNDDICDAFTLEPGVTVDNPASSNSCTNDFVVTTMCDNTLSSATLWYQIDVPEGASSIIITLNNQVAPDGVEGEVSIAVGPLVDCNALDVNDILYEDCEGFATNVHEINCAVEFGTYWIQIGSDDEMESGDFTIEYTFSNDGDPINDLCTEATDLVVNEFCEFTTFESTLKGACAELFDVGPCEFSMNQAVWFTITIPSGDPIVTDMDIMIEQLANPMIGVFEFECMDAGDTGANNGIINAAMNADGAVDCSQMPLTEGIVVVPGTTYHILVSTSTMEEIGFDISIKLNAPPENDDPCITQNNPPIDLTGGDSHNGTTCCARGPKDTDPLGPGGVADYENAECSAQTEDASVWYTYIPDENDDGYNIILEDGGANGPMSLEYYFGPADGGCTGNLTLLGSSCNSNTADIKIGNCFEPGDVLFVKVTTDDADTECGDFILTITPATCGDMADDCIDTADSDPIMPITNPEFTLDYFCVTGCLDYACPEDDAMGGCGEFTQAPTVWFQVETDMLAAQMFTTVEAFGNWTPVWSIWSGTSCDDLAIVNFGGAPPCSSGDATPELHQIGVFDDVPNYWIAVTLDPNSLPSTGLDDGSFELCVATTINAIICLGEEVGDCTDPSLVMEVTDREVEDQPLTGPFCQGEEVTINIQFEYDASESGADWLIGMVPIFGEGWDLTAFDYAANAPVGNGLTADWYVEGSATAPIIQEPNPILCTFVNSNGDLTLCNQLCDPCPDCPQQGMLEGDPLPSGYFWVTNGGNAGCDNDGSPGEGWGIGSTQASITWEFTLMVKEFTDPADCFDQKDLSISFQTFSDGVGGCWEDPVGECILDRAMFSPAWEIECEAPPAVEGPDQEICHDGMVNIDVATADGSTTQIQVDVEDNPNVTGEMSHTFDGGFGNIDDNLLNPTNDIQIVIYNVYAVDPSLPCPGVVNQIEVTLYPELKVTFPPVFICEGDCTDITPDVVGGFGVPFMYEWSTGESTPSINVCPVVPTTYFVTVTDGLGCEDIGEVEVDVKPPVELLLPPSISVCKDDNFDPFNPDYVVCLDFISGSSGFAVTWVTELGLAGEPAGFAGECFAINEVLSSAVLGSPAGTYTLTANVTDFFGCMGTTEMEVIITGELTLVPTVQPYACGETEAILSVFGIDAAGNPITTFILYGGCPDDGLGEFIDQFDSSSGNVLFPAIDLLSYTCVTIVGQTASGCQTTIDVQLPISQGTPIDIGGDEMVCLGEEATITIANAGDFTGGFSWNPDIGSTGSITFTPDSTATYIVEATDGAGCVSQALWTVVVNDLPIVDITGSPEFCVGSSATVTASGGVSYTWSNGGITGPDYTSSTDDETVTVTATDINGCTATASITFTEEPSITINLGNQDICDGLGDTVTVNSTYTNISWVNSLTGAEVSDTFFYIITGGGTFDVTAIDPIGGCDAAGSFTVEEFITPIINIPDTVNVCRQDNGVDSLCIDFIAIASASANGSWNQDGIIPGFTLSDFPLNDACFTDIQTGCYPFTYTTNTATIPCMDTMATMILCVKACPCPSPATQGIPDICNFGTYNLENAELTTDPGTWSVQSGPLGQDILNIISGTVFTATGLIPGPYVVRFTLDNPGGGSCEVFSDQTINVVGQDMIDVIDQGQLCNIEDQQFPTTLDLFDLISVDLTSGGTWVQIGTETTIPITGGSMISSAGITDFTETFTFEYTSGDTGGICPPTVTEVTVDIFDCTCPIIIVAMDTLCNNGLPVDLFTLLTNDDNLEGSWSTNGVLSGVSMFEPNGLPSGAYDITFTLDSSPGPGCETVYSNVIIVRREAVAEMQQGPQPCTVDTGNGPTTVNLYDWLVPGYTLGSWSQTGGDILPLPDDGNSIAVVDFVTQDIGETFTYVFTTIGAQDPCMNTTVEIVITVVDCNCPPIMITEQDSVCNDAGIIDLCALVEGSDPGSFEVTSAGGTSYPERIDATGCIFDAIGLNQGTYTITYTLDADVTGTCIGSVSTTFDVVNYISTEIVMEPDQVCNDPNGNGLMVLNFTTFVGNAGSGTWSDDDNSGVIIETISDQQSVSFVGVPAGSYNFTYTIDNAEPCTDPSLIVTVEVTDDCNCAPIDPDDPEDVCNTDGPIDLTQYDDPDMPGIWSSTVLTVEDGNSLIITGVEAGVYELVYTLVTLIPDCPEFVTVNIMIGEPANPGIPAEDLTLCEGDVQVITLDDRLTDADLGGSWTETSTTMSTGFSGNMFNSDGQSPGTYTFQYEITDNDPCPDVMTSVTIIIDPNPVSDAGMDVELDCSITSGDLGGTGTSTGDDFVYSWTLGGTEVSTDATLLDVAVEGTYQLLVTNSVTGCVDSSTVEVTKSDDLPTFTVTETNITCNGDNDGFITISDQNGGDGNYTYSLNGGDQVSDPSSFTGLSAGDDYTIAIFDGIECSTVQPFIIVEPDPVSVTIAADGLEDGILDGQPGDEFVLTIDPVSENIDSVVWSDFNDPTIIFCSGSVAECASITISPTLNTTVVYVEVFDANNCSANDQVQIQLNQIVDVVFPNIITPNGDNVNDFFFIASDDVEQVLSMQIFDRWGELIWEAKNFSPRVPSEGWNGKFNDSPVVPGVYVFTVEVLFVDMSTENFSGDVTVTDGE